MVEGMMATRVRRVVGEGAEQSGSQCKEAQMIMRTEV